MNRNGSALLTVLWLTVLLGSISASAVGIARLGTATTANRLALTRGKWAAEGCLALAQARFAETRLVSDVPRTSLGAGIHCAVSAEDPGGAVNLNLGTPAALLAVLGRPDLTDAVLDWRDADEEVRPAGAERGWYESRGLQVPRNAALASTLELALVRGFDDSVLGRVRPVLTTRGPGTISLASAPSQVLATIPGFGPEAVELVLRAREEGRPLSGVEDLFRRISPSGKALLAPTYAEALRLTTSSSGEVALRLEGAAEGARAVHRLVVTVVPTGDRLAVVRREVE